MLFVDKAVGSNVLVEPLRALGLTVEPAHLDYADVEFAGRGEKNEPVMIGVELKRLNELTSDWERFAGEQVPKMVNNYAHRYLLWEGVWTANKRGVLLQRSGRRTFKPVHGNPVASQLRKKLITIEMCAGIHVHHVDAQGRHKQWSVETVRYLHDLYRWWTDDAMDEHKSHIVNYQAQGLIPLNPQEHALAAWPGLSSKKAKPVARHFKNSIRRACVAPIDEWAEIEVVGEDKKARRIGSKLAEKLDKFLDGKKP